MTQAEIAVPQPAPELHAIIEYYGINMGENARSGAGAIIRAPNGIIQIRDGAGDCKNVKQAEYKALIEGFRVAQQFGYTHLRIRGNSEAIHNQINGGPLTADHSLVAHQVETNQLLQSFRAVQSEYVPRGVVSDAGIQACYAVLFDESREYEREVIDLRAEAVVI